jgi:hypothetical protein
MDSPSKALAAGINLWSGTTNTILKRTTVISITVRKVPFSLDKEPRHGASAYGVPKEYSA